LQIYFFKIKLLSHFKVFYLLIFREPKLIKMILYPRFLLKV